MTSIAGLLASRWVLTLPGAVLAALLVWFFGPLWTPLEGDRARGAVAAALVLAWAAANLLIGWRRQRRAHALAAGVTGIAEQSAEIGEEVAALREKLAVALARLRGTRRGRGYIYEQPWYAIIGPPGAGKTTALLNAGLTFPLADTMGQGAVAGVGGTRLCDWWFTDDAVLIDTAGRYTTQDSDAAVDRAGWEAFLDLLKRTRGRQPLNGVLVVIGLGDIARAPESERAAHARAISRRVRELEVRLGVRMPVYLLLTKADLLAGFTETFGDLDRARRAQVWGATFPLARAATGPDPGAVFEAEYRLLVERLNEQLIERLQSEGSLDRRALIAGFPAQVASLAAPLAAFVRAAFGGTEADPAPLLRGVYLTSGTQEGTPIDRLTGALARSFGLDQRRLSVLRPEQGRGYFLAGLLREVVFGEAMLVAQPPAAARRARLRRAAAFGSVGLAAALAVAALWSAADRGARATAAMGRALDAYEQTANDLPLNPVADADLPRLLPLLARAQDLARAPGTPDAAARPWRPGSFLLSQDDKLAAAAHAVYRHALGYALLPRLIWRLEAEMRGRLNQPEFLYEATRVYLMLGGAGPLDRGLVHDWMMLDWRSMYPDDADAAMRAELLRHLDALLADRLPDVRLDGELVARARGTFAQVSAAQRAYSRIRPSAAAQALPPWRPRDALGPVGVAVFARLSGKSMDDGIPGFFTLDGFHRVLIPALGAAASGVASESWVLGERFAIDPESARVHAVERDVIRLYEADYIASWEAMLNDIGVAPMRSLPQGAQALYVIAAPQSPMRNLLAAIARQVTLSVPPASAGPAAVGPAGATAAPSDEAARLAALFGTPQAGRATPLPPGYEVDEYFAALRDLVGTGVGAPIDVVLRSLGDLQQTMAKMAASGGGAAAVAAAGDDPTPALRAEAAHQPPPLARWLETMAANGAALRGGNARERIVLAFNGAGGPAQLCASAVKGNYPFNPGSGSDVPLEDFGRLFARGGLIDAFFNTELGPYVVTTGPSWQLQAVEGASAPVKPADLLQFQRAGAIRDMFFAGGGGAPAVRFVLTPVSVDAGTQTATLDFDGTSVVAARTPPRAVQIVWPGPTRMQTASLVFDPPPASGAALRETGPWAMFRLLGHARAQPAGSADHYLLVFQSGEREAVFDLRADAAVNPFTPGVLAEFRCPSVQ